MQNESNQTELYNGPVKKTLPASTVKEPKQRTIAKEIVEFCNTLATTSEECTSRVAVVLSSVALNAPPICDLNEKSQAEYPPLFAELRSALQRIEKSITLINDNLDRTEL